MAQEKELDIWIAITDMSQVVLVISEVPEEN